MTLEDQEIGILAAIEQNTGAPLVVLQLGQESGQFPPDDAIAFAFGVIEVAGDAQIDASAAKWGKEELKYDDEQVHKLLRTIKAARSMDTQAEDVRKEVLAMFLASMHAEVSTALAQYMGAILGMKMPEIKKLIDKFRRSTWGIAEDE